MARNLRLGDRGQDVRAVQEGLNSRRAAGQESVAADGVFDKRTDAAVRRFQNGNGLKSDGVVGRATLAKIFPLATYTTYVAIAPKRAAGDVAPPMGRTPSALELPYRPMRYPGLQYPLTTASMPSRLFSGKPSLAEQLTMMPGSNFLVGRNPRIFDSAADMTVSGVHMIGDEDVSHKEIEWGTTTDYDLGNAFSVSTYTKYTHVFSLGRKGDWRYQPNAQYALDHGMRSMSWSLAPFEVQYAASDRVTLCVGGGDLTVTFDKNGLSFSTQPFTVGVAIDLFRSPKS